MPIQAYDPDYHLIGPVRIREIIISQSAIQLECYPVATDNLPYMSVPQDGILSVGCSKKQLFEIIDRMAKPVEIISETNDEIFENPLAGVEEYKAFCADIEEGLLQTDEMPGIIEIENQYPLFHQVHPSSLLVGYRPMGRVIDPFDIDQFMELRSNRNCFLIDKVIHAI